MDTGKVGIIPTANSGDVKLESTFEKLNGSGLVRATDAVDQWYILIDQGWKNTNIPKNELVLTYLAIMLHRFSTRTALFEQFKSFNYAEFVLNEKKKIDSSCWRDIADMCLQFVALFPKYGSYRHEMRSYEYVAELGVTMYKKLAASSKRNEDVSNKVFPLMVNYFGLAIMVLRESCPGLVCENTGLSSMERDAVIIPSDHDAMELERVRREMEGMFCEPPINLSGTNH